MDKSVGRSSNLGQAKSQTAIRTTAKNDGRVPQWMACSSFSNSFRSLSPGLLRNFFEPFSNAPLIVRLDCAFRSFACTVGHFCNAKGFQPERPPMFQNSFLILHSGFVCNSHIRHTLFCLSERFNKNVFVAFCAVNGCCLTLQTAV